MLNGPENDFKLNVDVYLESFADPFALSTSSTRHLTLKATFENRTREIIVPFTTSSSTLVSSTATDKSKDESYTFKVTLSMIITKQDIKLWWPNGYGDQNLYVIGVQYCDDMVAYKSDWVEKRIGKRYITFMNTHQI